MELVPKAEFSIVTRASSKAWIPELIAAAGPEVTESYIDFFTATIRNRNTRVAYARACWQFFDWCKAHGLCPGKPRGAGRKLLKYLQNVPFCR
jgi:hypothetical protein